MPGLLARLRQRDPDYEIPWPSACSDDDAIYLLENTFFLRFEIANPRKKFLPIPLDLCVP
jgi:hypothetical protein